MKEIYDIKTILFGIIYSFDYLFFIFVFLFLIVFYLILNYFFDFNRDIKKPKITKTNYKELLEFIEKNIDNFSRDIFYREVSLFIRKLIFDIYKDENIFSMTRQELKENYKTKYDEIFKEVYFTEFDLNKEENLDTRKEIIKNLKNLYFKNILYK